MNKIFAIEYFVVFILYFIIVAGYGYFVYWKRNKSELDAKGTFLQKER
jgi:SSS family solute:Na+ symporter